MPAADPLRLSQSPPLHRHALVGKPHPKLGLGNGNVDKAQPIQGPGMQFDMVRLGIAVYQQQQKERTIPTRAENECLVMLRVILRSRLQNDERPVQPIQQLPKIVPVSVIDEGPARVGVMPAMNDVPGAIAGVVCWP